MLILTCKLRNEIINCYDGTHSKEQLKKWATKKILLCPVCDKPYEYCHGQVKTPYFRHMNKNECEDRFSESETEEHLNGKRDLFEWIKKQKGVNNVVLEGWIPETKQRPDIMFEYGGKKYVIEYQCSPIATEYVERHELYKASGITDIWILGTDKYLEKSEIGKNFRMKEIEKHTDIYYDVYGKSIISKSIDISRLQNVNIDEMLYFFMDSDFRYYNENKRKLMYDFILENNLVIRSLSEEYISPLNLLEFNDNKILIKEDAINNIQNFYFKQKEEKLLYQNKLTKLSDFRKLIFEYYSAEHDINFSCMPSQSDGLGFKYAKQYFGFNNIANYPTVNFCKINYIYDSAIYEKLITVDVSDNGFKQVISLLDGQLADEIKFKKEINDFVKKYERQRKEEFDDLKGKLSQFTNKPIYLLFKENNNKLPSNIRFKFFEGTSDDLLVVMRCLYKDLKFLKEKNANKYVFMIPRKKWRTSSTGRSQYKVWNHPREVISDFEELGFTVLTYDDLITEVK
ncbi:MAG: hypothetical protein IJA10_10525 [Lachnospiraceae bacterium]|nr:hypothetical protein [Lachnospiraceae bacterium]